MNMIPAALILGSAVLVLAGILSGQSVGAVVPIPLAMTLNAVIVLIPVLAARASRRSPWKTPVLPIVTGSTFLFALTFTFTNHCESLAAAVGAGFSRRVLVVVTGLGWPAVMTLLTAMAMSERLTWRGVTWFSLTYLLSPVLFFSMSWSLLFVPLSRGVELPAAVVLLGLVCLGPLTQLLSTEAAAALFRFQSVPVPARLSQMVVALSSHLALRPPRVACLAVPNVAVLLDRPVGRSLIVLDSKRSEELPDEQLAAVIVHELGHLKLKHSRKLLVMSGVTTLLILPAASYIGVAPNGISAVHAATVLAVIVFRQSIQLWLQRRFELEADRIAADAVGADAVSAALEALRDPIPASTETGRGWGSHPSVSKRKRSVKRSPALNP